MTKKFQVILLCLIVLTGCSAKMPTLGINSGQFSSCPDKPNCVNSQAKNEKHAIQPIIFNGNAKEAATGILKLINDMKNAKIVTQQDHYIHAEFVSSFFKFVDDVEFYFPETEDNTTTIQVKSASRIGYSDLGVNRKRLEKIRNLLK